MAEMATSVSLFRRNLGAADRDTVKFDRTTQDVGHNIDKLSGRLGVLVDVAATLGPALIPTATALVPLMAGLTNQLGFAAIAGGSTILAFQGVGDALKALNEQQLHPSAANLEKLHEAMATLGPAGRDFVRELQAMRPELQKLQDAAQAGLFPGMTEGITSLTTRLPQAQRIISEVTDTLGGLLADAGKSLAGPQWNDFFNMLESEARPTLQDLGESIGQVTKGLADLWVAFAPLNRDFSQGMLGASKSFADWADGLSKTAGFQEFISYLQTTGPQVAQTLGALSNALLQVLEAASPLGGPALKAIEAFSKAIAAIADSDLGTPIFAAIAAWRAYAIAVAIADKAQTRFNMSQAFGGRAAGAAGAKGGMFSGYTASLLGVTSAQERATTAAGKTSATISAQRGAFAKGAAGAALLGVAMTGVSDKVGLTNTAMLGLTGFLVGGGVGAAFGATAGAALDLAHANDSLEESLAKLAAMAGKVDFATFNKQLDDAQAKVDDLKHVTGFGDLLSDTAKNIGGALKDPFSTSMSRSGDAQSQIDDAKQTQQRTAAWKALGATLTAAGTAGVIANRGFTLTAAGAREAAFSVDQFAFSVRGANAAIERGNTWDSYRRSLLDAKDAVEKAGKTLNKNGSIIRGQGRDVQRLGLTSRDTLRGLASGAIQTATGMKNVANRMKFLNGARKDFINLAHGMGVSKAAARALADQFGLIARIHAKPKVEEQGAAQSRARIAKMRAEIERLKPKTVQVSQKGADNAKATILQLRAAIASLRDRTVTITERRRYTGNSGIGSAGQVTPADGMTIPGQRQPYGDKIPALLAPGEEVISNRHGQADRHRALLKRINANMMSNGGTVLHFADGGTARRHPNRHNNDDPTPHVNHFAQALKEATRSLNKEKAARDALVSKRDELSGTVRDQFLTDPFGQGNVWAEGGGNPLGILKADIAKANAFKSSLVQLRKNGLSGDALASIASTGDIGKAQALLSMGKGGLGQYQSLFNQRAQAAAAVGSYAGSAAYGAAIASQTHDIRQLNATVHRLEQQLKHRHTQSQKNHKANADHTGKAVAKGVNSAASKSRRGRR